MLKVSVIGVLSLAGIVGMSLLFPVVPASAQQQAAQPDLGAALRMTPTADALSTLEGDPVKQELVEGRWTYYQEGEPPVPGRKCAATFASVDGMFSVAGLGGGKDPAVLLLTGKDVPVPSAQTQIRVTLHQTDSDAQSVTAINFAKDFTNTGQEVGTLAFAVPSLNAAISGILDEAEFAVDVDGERVYSLKYKGGDLVKAELKKCTKAAR